MLFQQKDSEKYAYDSLRASSIELENSQHGEDDTGYADSSLTRRHRNDNAKSILSTLLKCCVYGLAAFGIFAAIQNLYTLHSSRRPSCNCGSTIDEALSNSCRYDEMAAGWLPPACRDDELSDQFSKAGPNPDGSWTYYADKNKTRELTAYDVSQLPLVGGHFFATHQWHVVHCSFYWKKLSRSRELGTVMEKRYETEMHLNHCEMMFLKRDPLDAIVTEAGVSLKGDVLVVAKSKHKHPEAMEDGKNMEHEHEIQSMDHDEHKGYASQSADGDPVKTDDY